MNVLEARRRLLGADVQKKTAEGNPISVRSLARMYSRIEMQGWTEQKSTTGAQLLDIDSGTIRGWNIENITNTLEAGQTYTFTNIDASVATTLLGKNSSGEDIIFGVGHIGAGQSAIFEMPGEVDSLVLGGGSAGLQKNNHFMLNAGSEALPYEPYTGNQPSPSPDYPQEIINAGKYNEETQKWEYEVKLTGANLLDAKKYVELNSKYYEIGPNGGVIQAVGDGRPVGLIPVVHTLPPGTFYIRGDKSYGQVIIDGVTFNMSVPGSYVILTLEKETDIAHKFYVGGNTSYPSEEYFPMVSRVQDATYEPYHTPQTVLLQSDRPLTKWDRLEKREGQWGWVFKSAEIVLDGSEDEVWMVDVDWIYFYSIRFFENNLGNYNDVIYCNKLRKNTNIKEENIFKLSGAGYFEVTNIDIGGEFTPENLKTWLTQNPLTVWYETTEETFTPLSESEQRQMNALHTNYPTTVLVNDQGCEMKLTYKTKKSLEVT